MTTMPRQNRVLPTGEIVAAPFRGTLMGNRGILHDAEGRLGRARWRHKAWIACLVSFKGRRRPVMAPNRYTELFFPDEAVALAAGHRPCFECRRRDLVRFLDAWVRAHGTRPSAPALDAVLHAARIDQRTRRQTTFRARLGDLPDGAFVAGTDGAPALLRDGALHPFRDGRYGAPTDADGTSWVNVLTPEPTVATLAAGYRVESFAAPAGP